MTLRAKGGVRVRTGVGCELWGFRVERQLEGMRGEAWATQAWGLRLEVRLLGFSARDRASAFTER